MKRPSLPRRRQRKVGLSSYSGKTPYQYSAAHKTWQLKNRGSSAKPQR